MFIKNGCRIGAGPLVVEFRSIDYINGYKDPITTCRIFKGVSGIGYSDDATVKLYPGIIGGSETPARKRKNEIMWVQREAEYWEP